MPSARGLTQAAGFPAAPGQRHRSPSPAVTPSAVGARNQTTQMPAAATHPDMHDRTPVAPALGIR